MPSLQPASPPLSQFLATPQDLWDLALPKRAVNAAAFDPGEVSPVAHTGTGIGVVEVSDLPYDSYRVNVRITQSGNTIPTVGAVTPVRVAASTGTVTPSGTPAGSYQAQIQVMSTGTLGTARFRYSIDGGARWSPDVTIPGDGLYAPPLTGLTLRFQAGAGPVFFEAGDLFTFSTIGLAKFTYSLFSLPPPVEREGTGQVVPLGMPARDFRVTVHVLQGGTLGTGLWRYNVNGGAFTSPIAFPLDGLFVIPNIGITLSFDPGPGPVFFGGGDTFSFRTWGTSAQLTAGAAPVPLVSPVDTGLRLNFVPTDPAGAVNFVTSDVYTFTTTASRDVLAALQSASDTALGYLAERYSLPLLGWDSSIVGWVCDIARLSLLTRKGLTIKEDRQFIKASENAEMRLSRVGEKKLHPRVIESAPVVYVPAVYTGPDDHGIMEGTSNGYGP